MTKNNKSSFMIVITLLILVTIFSAIYYQHGAESDAKNRTYQQLTDIAQEQTETLNTRLDGQYILLETFANSLMTQEDCSRASIIRSMDAIVIHSHFLHLAYIEANGSGFLNTGENIHVLDRDYFEKALSGMRVFERVENGKIDGETRFVQAVPMFKDGRVFGILFGSYDECMLKELLDTQAFSGHAVTYLCDAKGEIVLGSDSEDYMFGEGDPLEDYHNILDGYTLSESADEKTKNRIATDLANGNQGVFTSSIEGRIQHIIYVPLGINDWFIINGIPSEVVAESIRETSQTELMLLMVIFFCSTSMAIFLIWQEKKNARAVSEEQEKLRISEEEYRIAAQQSNKQISRYDIKTKTLSHHKLAAEIFGIPENYENVPESCIESGLIAAESVKDFVAFFESMQRGDANGSTEVRMKSQSLQAYRWFHGDFTLLRGKNGEPRHTVISFYDITEQREHELAYELWRQSVSKLCLDTTAIFEHNFTRDEHEIVSGKLRIATENKADMSFNERTAYWASHLVYQEDVDAYLAFLNLERLLRAFYGGSTEENLEFRAYTDGTEPYRWMRVTVHMAEYPSTHEVKGFLIVEDIHEKKVEELAIKERSETDPLTGVLNRSTFETQVNELFKKLPSAQHALIMIDLDHFKQINDSLGHIAGDRVLLKIASRLKSVLRKGDLFGRMGGDEFMICLKEISHTDAIEKRAEFMCRIMRFEVAKGISSSGSLGVSIYPRDGATFNELYRCADIAVYKAKENGRNRYEFYAAELVEREILTPTPIDRLNMDEEMNEACRGQMQKILSINQQLLNGENEEERHRVIMDAKKREEELQSKRTAELIRAQLDYIFQMSAIETFEVDINTHCLTLSAGALAKHSLTNQIVEDAPESMILNGAIHPDSGQEYRALYADMYAGKPNGSCIVKIKRMDDQYVLTRVSYRCLFDEQNRPVKAIGINEPLENITDARLRFEQEEKLQLLIRHDLIFYAKINLTRNRVDNSMMPLNSHYVEAPYQSYSDLFEDTMRCIPNAEEHLLYTKIFSDTALQDAYERGTDWIYRDFRLSMPNGAIVWTACSVQMLTSPYDGDLYIFLYVRDVNDRKKNELSLQSKAEFDSTRTFYTRHTMRNMVCQALRVNKDKERMLGVSILKISNMNEITDRFGISCVDRLMISINRKLRYSMQNRHITARTWDNEIIMFFDDIPSNQWMTELGEYILYILRNPSFFTTVAEQYAVYQTGATVLKAKNADFETLYRHALMATDKADIFKPYIQYDSLDDVVPSDAVKLLPMEQRGSDSLLMFSLDGMEGDILAEVAKILLATKDMTHAMNEVLAVLGAFYDGERAYILEIDETNKTVNNTFEWCAHGISSQIDHLQGDPLSDMPTFMKAYEMNQTIIIENVDALSEGNTEYIILRDQGIHSLYVVPYCLDDTVIGFVGVDNPGKNIGDASVINAVTYFLMNDLLKRRAVERDHYMGRYDILSAALSRNSYVQYLRETKMESLSSMGVIMMNVSALKELNQTFGNEYGDNIIRNAAETLQLYCGVEHVYRYSGATFLTLLPDILYEKFLNCVDALRLAFDKNVNYDASIGHTWSETAESIEKLVSEADEFMNSAKHEQYRRLATKKEAKRDAIVQELLQAIEENKYVMYLQPKANVNTLQVCGAEALVRIHDPQYGILSPGRFIPALEHLGLIRHIDFFIFEEVLRLLERWSHEGRMLFPISLNFSRATILEPDVIQSMLEISDRYQVPREWIEIEITESMGDLQWETIQSIGNSILNTGFRLSMDDFGAKYSNLSALASVPFSVVKLDKSLIDRIVSNEMTFSIVQSVIALCTQYGISVVAEGVETEEQLQRLRTLGCPVLQGYYINKPLPLEEFERKYQKEKVFARTE